MSEKSENKKINKAKPKKKKNYISDSPSSSSMEVKNKKIEEEEYDKLKINLQVNDNDLRINQNNFSKNNDSPNNQNQDNLDIFKKDNIKESKNHTENIFENNKINPNNYNENNSSKSSSKAKDNKNKYSPNKNQNNELEKVEPKMIEEATSNKILKPIKEILSKENQQEDFNDEILNKNSYYKSKGELFNNMNNGKNNFFQKGFGNKSSNDRSNSPKLISFNNRGFNNDRQNYNNNHGINDFEFQQRGNDNNRGNRNYRGNYRGRGMGNRGGARNKYENNNREFPENNFNRRNDYIHTDFKFFKEHEKIILKIKSFYEYLDSDDIIKFLKIIIQNGKTTIFEFMDDLHRENIITRHVKFSNAHSQRNYSKKINIYEQDKDTLDSNIKFMIDNFKTLPQQNTEPLIYPSEFYEKDEEKRRKLLKDENGFFNYIPTLCSNLARMDCNEFCIYSHTENERKYHSLVYKTQFCSKSCQTKETCENAHDAKEFRKIYEFNQKEGYTKFINKIEKFLKKINILKNYLDYVEYPSSFSLDTFKVHPCKFKNCNIERHLCYFYHNLYERRRHPFLFNLENNQCENYFLNNENDVLRQRECPEKDFCKFFHNKHELVYNENNFRKQINCQRQINQSTGKCIFFETCYGIHKKIQEDEDLKLRKKVEKYDKVHETAKKLYQENKELNKKFSQLEEEKNKLIQALSCRKCGKYFKNLEFTMLSLCGHFLCKKCLDDSLKNNDKACIICNQAIKKNTLLMINLTPENDDEDEQNLQDDSIRVKESIINNIKKTKNNKKDVDSD